MDEAQAAYTLWIVGAVLVAVFVILNFGLERRWFPRPRRMATSGNATPIPPLVGPLRRRHIVMGTIEGLVFIVGVICIAVGCSIMGTRGYGSF
jgi:uncharacterized protein YggT (Ycf19 family)